MSEDPTGNPNLGHGDADAGAPPAVFHLRKSLDPRIEPQPGEYVAATGAASITYVEQKLQQLNSNTQTFTVTPPSAGCVVQKNVMYTMTTITQFTASSWLPQQNPALPCTTTVPGGASFPLYGRDFAIATPNPLNRMVSNWQIQINNMTVQFNNQATDDMVHLRTTPKSRAWEGVTTRTPMFTNWNDAYATLSSLGSMAQLQGPGDVPPGAYEISYVIPKAATNVFGWFANAGGAGVPGWVFIATFAPDTPLANQIVSVPGGSTATSVVSTCLLTSNWQGNPATAPIFLVYDNVAPGNVPSINAVGIVLTTNIYLGSVGTVSKRPNPDGLAPPLGSAPHVSNYAIQAVLVDTVQCPPFGFSMEEGFEDQGMWGINTMLITAQLTDPGQARWLQGSQRGGLRSLNYVSFESKAASLWFTYLSPSATNLEVLPPRCVVPLVYKQVTTYADQNQVVQAKSLGTFTVPSYTFSQVSDLIMISLRPTYNSGATLPDGQASPTAVPFYETDYCATFPNQAFSQFQYANIPGILSNLAAHQLVGMCRKNGSTASVAQYGGLLGTGRMMLGGSPVGVGGSVILIRPGTDFALPLGIAPGSMGNIQLQFTINFINQGSRAAYFTCTTTALSSGFAVLDNGAARQVLVGLNSASLMKAELTMDKFMAAKLEGGGVISSLAAWGAKGLMRAARGALHGATKGALNGAFRGATGQHDDEQGGATAGSGMRLGMRRGAGVGAYSGAGVKRARGSLFAALSSGGDDPSNY